MIRIATSEKHDGDRTKLRAIADKVVELAIEGDVRAIREVADRLDGKPTQQIDMGTVEKHSRTDWTRDELNAVLNGAQSSPFISPEPDKVQ